MFLNTAAKRILFGLALLVAAALYPAWLNLSPTAACGRAQAMVRMHFLQTANALEKYRVDNGAWPPAVPMALPARYDRPQPQPVFTVAPLLTTPVSYLTSLYPDAAQGPSRKHYAYWTTGSLWLLYSAGFDEDYDLNPAALETDSTAGISLVRLLVDQSYDPTNGLSSSGDIWRASTGETSLGTR